MAFFFEEKNRLVIPNWRSFSNTSKIGELNGTQKIEINKNFKPEIEDIVDGWVEHKTIGMAADLIGVAIVCNKQNDGNVKEAAKFIIANKELCNKELIDAAKSIIEKGKDDGTKLDATELESFQERSNLYFVYQRISNLKSSLRTNPKNPILWVEIARYYSIIGQNEQAERAILNAYYLSPDNRFVLRAMARFFAHIDKVPFVHDIIRKSLVTRYDPWVMATEISLASMRDRYSRFMKSGLNMVKSSDFHPFNIAELNSSLGTVEIQSSLKKSRKLFNDSLISPNDNALAQAEWISHRERNLISVNPDNFKIQNDFEAKARDASEHGRWEDAVNYSKQWFLDMPFSRGAILFGSEIASNNLNNHDEAISLYRAGLTSHPNDHSMLNNIIYSSCLINRLEEAEHFMNRYREQYSDNSLHHKICFTATKGLYHFRKGYQDIGRDLYQQAIEMASEAGQKDLASIALVNYIREEIIAGNHLDEDFKQKIIELKENTSINTVKRIIGDIENLIAEKTNN
nr:hypothetical protein [uncultured Allomuricauda sp.]